MSECHRLIQLLLLIKVRLKKQASNWHLISVSLSSWEAVIDVDSVESLYGDRDSLKQERRLARIVSGQSEAAV